MGARWGLWTSAALTIILAGALDGVSDAVAEGGNRLTPQALDGAAPTRARPDPEIHLPGHVITPEQREDEVIVSTEKRVMGGLRRVFGIRTPRDRYSRAADFYVVRVSTLDVQAARATIESTGAKVLDYVPDAAFIVQMDGPTGEKLQELDVVEWQGRYKPDYKLSPELRPYLTGNRPAPRLASVADGVEGRPTRATPTNLPVAKLSESVEPLLVTIRHFRGATVEDSVARVTNTGGKILATSSDADLPIVRAELHPNDLKKLLEIPEVSLVELYVPPEVRNNLAIVKMGVPQVSTQFGLTGAGQIIGHADTGLDMGRNGSQLHADLRDRLDQAVPLGRPDTGEWSDETGHGTHTAASILGSGAASAGLYRGAAPGARLFHQALADERGALNGIPTEIGRLFEAAYAAGARIHSDSWGYGVTKINGQGGLYTTDALGIDRWIWNDGNVRDLLVVFSAGNDGEEVGSRSIGPPSTAKNCLTVGAIDSERPFSESPGARSKFSSWGPTQDGRYKPDVVAPGAWIASARTRGQEAYFDDDMEEGERGWTSTENSTWRLIQDGACFSSQSCRVNRPDGNYAHDIDATAITPWFAVENQAYVRFRARWNHAEPDGYGLWLLFDRGEGFDLRMGNYYGYPNRNPRWPGWDLVAEPVPGSFFKDGATRLRLGFNILTDDTDPPGDAPDDDVQGVWIDDVHVTSFGTWDDMWHRDLAQFEDPVDSNYTLAGGTSMATPLVAGAAAVVREYFERREGHAPSSALVKGVLINGAQRLEGQSQRPSYEAGWGAVRLDAVLPAPPRALLFVDDAKIAQGQVQRTDFRVTDSSKELRVTLVWHDPPGNQLIHDLGLTVTPHNGTPHSMAQPDGRNNVKGVDIPNPAAGDWTIEVTGDVVPLAEQPYALVITGAVER